MNYPRFLAGAIRLIVPCAFVTLLAVAQGEAQSGEKLPRRPRLEKTADSNSAVAYYNHGLEVLRKSPREAADAFYWATRLDPAWAEPIYGRFVALLVDRSIYDLNLYLTDRRQSLSNKRLREIDSIAGAALWRSPFVDTRLDGAILAHWVLRSTDGSYQLRDLMFNNGRLTAWVSYARGEYAESTRLYRELITREPRNIALLREQSRNFFAQRQLDSARAMVQRTLDLERKVETDSLDVGWLPHAWGEYSVGFLFSQEQQWDSARAAYERSLLDDLSFHPAHRELGRMRLVARDTAGALTEYAAAVALAPNDGFYLYELGVLLMTSGKVDSASKVLQRAITAEPWFAAPYLPLARIYEASGYPEEAVARYQRFLQLAPRSMESGKAIARRRLEKLKP